MTQCESVNINLSESSLNKIKSATKYEILGKVKIVMKYNQ